MLLFFFFCFYWFCHWVMNVIAKCLLKLEFTVTYLFWIGRSYALILTSSQAIYLYTFILEEHLSKPACILSNIFDQRRSNACNENLVIRNLYASASGSRKHFQFSNVKPNTYTWIYWLCLSYVYPTIQKHKHKRIQRKMKKKRPSNTTRIAYAQNNDKHNRWCYTISRVLV